MQHLRRHYLTYGEYILLSRGEDNQTAIARSHLIEVSKLVVPEFLEQLRSAVYPVFARAASANVDFYRDGWRFRTWAAVSDRDMVVQAALLDWARKFDAEEEWVLQGALSTLRQWNSDPEWRNELGTTGFYIPLAGEFLISDDEHRFQFSDWGWNPQLISWAAFRTGLFNRFEQELLKYEHEIRRLAESRGAVKRRRRFNTQHFEWFALYRLRRWSSRDILRWIDQHTDSTPDQTTVLKGIRTAASLLGWRLPRRRGR